MADLNYNQEILVEDQVVTVKRREVLSDRGWNLFKTIMVFLGGAAVLAWLIWLGYHWGSSGCYTCTQNRPVVAVVSPPASPTQTETAAIAELEKARLAIEKMVADVEQKTVAAQASALATASASAITTTVVAPPPQPQRRISVAKQAEPACKCPPQAQVLALTDPTAGMTPAQRRQYEIWVERR